jgi:hypothetical protein
LFLLGQAWTEPLLGFAVAATGWTLAHTRSFGVSVSVGLLFAVKQYGLLWLPALWASRRLSWRILFIAALLALMTAVPFVLWQPDAFWRGVVTFQFDQPFRADSLSVLAAVARTLGIQLPSAVGFLAAGVVAFLIMRQGRLTLAQTALGGAAIFLAFFVFNKQAFLNYYWFASVLLALAIVTSAGEHAAQASR